MLLEIELLYFVAMIATFIVLLLVCKLNAGVSLMCSALVGGLLYAIVSGNWYALNPRYYIEGAFGYIDTILVIVTAMIFIGGMEACGALDYVSAILVKALRKFPTILLLSFMLILMLPGMITGSSLSAIISCGAIVAPIMLKMGIPKQKVGAIVAFGAILGMVAPPINIPVMVICDVVDIPYTGFDLPLVLLTFPMAIVITLLLSRGFKKTTAKQYIVETKGNITKENNDVESENLVTIRKYKYKEVYKKNWLETGILLGLIGVVYAALLVVFFISRNPESALFAQTKLYGALAIIFGVLVAISVAILLLGKPYCVTISKEESAEIVDMNVLKELKWYVISPIIALVVLFLLQSVLPSIVGLWGTPLLFVLAFIPSLFIGRKKNAIEVVKNGVGKSISAMSLLMGVGMFLEIMTLNGVRGYFVINALCLPNVWQYISIAVAMPLFGGVSAFGSASILGGPFVMALLGIADEIFVASALSLVAATGEFLPPTAMSANFSGQVVGENKYSKISKAAIIPLLLVLVYALAFIIMVAPNIG